LRFHQAHDLFVVHQFFPGQARHHVDQVDVGVVLGNQAQRGAGGLEFAVLVVDQQGFLIGQCGLDPGIRGAAAKEFVDFGKDHGAHGKRFKTKGADYTGLPADHQSLALICIKSRAGEQQL
jgi:hypothetical protein